MGKGMERPRGRIPLREALLAAGVALGATNADAQTTSDRLPQAIFSDQLLRVPKPRIAMPPYAQIPSAGQIARIARDIEEASIPGGIYERDLNDPHLTRERLADIIDDQSQAAALVSFVSAGIIEENEVVRLYKSPSRIPGHRHKKFKKKNGGETWCNSVDAIVDGVPANILAAHCVPGIVEEDDYYFMNEGPDVAAKDIDPKTVGEALVLDPRVTDESVIGRIAVMDTIDRYERRIVFTTIYNRMTEPVLNILYPQGLSLAQRRQLMNGFWHVAPAQQGDKATNGQGFNFQGESGNPMIVRVPALGPHAFGLSGPFHSGIPRIKQCENKRTGLCTTIQFSAGPDTAREVARMGRAMNGKNDLLPPVLRREGRTPPEKSKN